MNFARWSQLLFSQIRLPLFICLLTLPFALCLGYFALRAADLKKLQERFLFAEQKEKRALKNKLRKEQMIEKHSRCDPFFIDKNLESFVFLQTEREHIASLLRHPALADGKKLEERLRWIDSETNRLLFKEEAIRTSATMTETEEKQLSSVQMDEKDLAKILTLLEGDSIEKKPLTLISDCRIKKTKTPLGQEVFYVNIEFIKREWK